MQTKHFLLTDTSQDATGYAPFDSYIDFPIYYFGPIKDTIPIGRPFSIGRTPRSKWPDSMAVSMTYSGKNLRIEVDTGLVVNSSLIYLHPDESINYDSTRNFYAYLFIIHNISDSIMWMGRAFSVSLLHMELKDRKGNWLKVGKKLSEIGICGTSQPQIYLRPGEIIISKVKCFKGTFTTEARLAFGYRNEQVYSNIFRQSVNERIFVSLGPLQHENLLSPAKR